MADIDGINVMGVIASGIHGEKDIMRERKNRVKHYSKARKRQLITLITLSESSFSLTRSTAVTSVNPKRIHRLLCTFVYS